MFTEVKPMFEQFKIEEIFPEGLYFKDILDYVNELSFQSYTGFIFLTFIVIGLNDSEYCW